MLVYVHVPFCRQKCSYCAFHSAVVEPAAMERYVAALFKEAALWGDRLGRRKASTLYLGGGTPSLLPFNALFSLANKLRRAFEFKDGFEFTMEANPDSLGREYLNGLKGVGVNRLSMGVQSFNNEFLKLLGRCHTAEQAMDMAIAAREAGFANLSLDLIWGLPGQRLTQWRADLKAAVELNPAHLSCYSLTMEGGTPLAMKLAYGEITPLPDKDLALMFVDGAEYLESLGYLQYEISNFAKMGMHSRHNQGYWEGRDYLGLGPSAVSTVDGRRWENPKDLDEYVRAVEEGLLGRDAEELTPDIRAKEMVMLRLRTSAGLRLGDYRELTGRDLLKRQSRLVQALVQNRLARVLRGRLKLTRNGMLVADSIIERIFALEGLDQDRQPPPKGEA